MRFINREVAIVKVAAALGLRFDNLAKIHCWHPERHKNNDRTASVGIRSTNNTVKCFGCNSKPMGPIDMVMDVLGVSAADAALWIAARFDVPFIPAGRRLTHPTRRRHEVGLERGLALLVRSGLWASLPEAARGIAPVLLELSEKQRASDAELTVQISYLGISRYSGVRSPTAIRKALVALSEVGFLRLPETAGRRSPERKSATYTVTPNSDELWELAQAVAAQMKEEIAAERELRARLKKEKVLSSKEQTKDAGAAACTKYKTVYSTDSANQKDAIPGVAGSSPIGRPADFLNTKPNVSSNPGSRRRPC